MLLFQPGSQLGCRTILTKPARIGRHVGLSSSIHNGAGEFPVWGRICTMFVTRSCQNQERQENEKQEETTWGHRTPVESHKQTQTMLRATQQKSSPVVRQGLSAYPLQHHSFRTLFKCLTQFLHSRFFFNPLLFASCTDTFSKWCKITRGVKSAQ
jgi:hypothetical protein